MNANVGLELPLEGISREHRAIVIGAGLAGCAIASELSLRGYQCSVYDQLPEIASATSALPVATIQPASSGDKTHTQYFTRAFDICCQQLSAEIFTRCGALQLISSGSNKPCSSEHARRVDRREASDLAGTKLDADAWYLEQAGYLNPQALCKSLLDESDAEFHPDTHVNAVRKTGYGWQLLSLENTVIDESQLVVIASADAAARFEPSRHIPLQFSHGQINLFASRSPALKTLINGIGNSYLIPAKDAIWSGATHHRDTCSIDGETDSFRNRNNALKIATTLQVDQQPLRTFTGIRASTPDRLPVIGALPDAHWYRDNYSDLRHGKPASHFAEPVYSQGLYIVSGFGGRGATQALYSAQLVSGLINGSNVDTALLKALHPARFLLRSLRKGLVTADQS